MPPGGPFGGGQPPEPKGNLRPLLDLIGIDWPTTEIVWNAYNPHPAARRACRPRSSSSARASGAADAFNPEQIASVGPAGDRDALPRPAPRPSRRVRPRVHPAAADQPTRAAPCSGARSSSRASWASAASTRAAATSPPARATPWPPASPARPRPSRRADAEEGRGKKKDEEGREAAGQDQRDRDRRPRHDRRAVLRAAAAARSRTSISTTSRSCSTASTCWPATSRSSASGRSGPSTARSSALEDQAKQVRRGARRTRPRRPRTRPANELDEAQKAFDKQVEPVQNHTDCDERTKEIQLANLQDVAQRRLDVEEGRSSRTRSRRRSARARRELGAEDPRDPEQRAVRGRRAAALAAAHPRPGRLVRPPDAARTWAPTRSGWPDRRGRVASSQIIEHGSERHVAGSAPLGDRLMP